MAIKEEKSVLSALYSDLPAIRAEDPVPAEIDERLAESGRTQRELGRRAYAVARALASILREMENNRVGEADDIRRLADRVIAPIDELVAENFPNLAGGFEGVRRGETAAARGQAGLELADDLERTIAAMEAVLANMVKLEGFSEIVKRLRAIMTLHDEATEAARKAYERELEEIFK